MGLYDGRPVAEDIRRALGDGVREGLQLEYKREVNTDNSREWAADVTALANTAGGVIIVGVGDDDGRPGEVVGVNGSDVDGLQQWMNSVIRDRVEPTLPGLSIEPVAVDGHTVLAVAIPRSWAAPHLVRDRSRWQLFRRNSVGKYPVSDVIELRGLFAQAEDVATRIRQWHRDRVLAVQAGDAPLPIKVGPFLILTARSLAMSTPGMPSPLDVTELKDDPAFTQASPPHADAWGTRFNLDGIAQYATDGTSYLHVHRDTSIEVVDTNTLASVQTHGAVLGREVAGTLIDAAWTALQLARAVGQTVPVTLQASMNGVAGATFAGVPSGGFRTRPEPTLNRDSIRLPETTVSRWPDQWDDVAQIMRPGLDVLWNAGGHPHCLWFGEDGRWMGPQRT